MYGWKQLKSKFEIVLNRDLKENKIKRDVSTVSYRWFPAAHLDYYVATPLNLNLFAIGSLQDIHKYEWINIQRGKIPANGDAYCIVPGNDFKNPDELFSAYFSEIQRSDSIPIFRNKKIANYFYVYRLLNYNGKSFNGLNFTK
jgi:hypothetical protein